MASVLRNKKAVTQTMTLEMIYLVLGIALVVAGAFVVARFFAPAEADVASVNNIKVLAEAIKTVPAENRKIVPFFSNKGVVAFLEGDISYEGFVIKKPLISACSRSCICLADADGKPNSCQPLEGIQVLAYDYKSGNIPHTIPEGIDVVIEGPTVNVPNEAAQELPYDYIQFVMVPWESILSLTVEKHEIAGKTYVIVYPTPAEA